MDAGLYSPSMKYNYSTHLIEDIQEWDEDNEGCAFDDFVSTREYRSTGETFYDVTAEPASLIGDATDNDLVEVDEGGNDGGEDDDDDDDEDARIASGKPPLNLPTQPVATNDEKELFRSYRNKPRFITGRDSTTKIAIRDWDKMALEWNSDVMKNHWRNCSSSKIYFLKTASHLRAFNEDVLRQENSENTMAQPSHLNDGRTNQAVADATRESLRHSSASLPQAVAPLLAIPAPNTGAQPGGGIRPPASTQQVNLGAFVGRTPSALPSSSSAVGKMQCGRCGGHKAGSHHTPNSAINTLEYCTAFANLSQTVVDDLRTKGFPKLGYSIDEAAPAKKSGAHKCGRCGLLKEGDSHPSKPPFCSVLESEWKPGHVPKGKWAVEEDEEGEEEKREEQMRERAKRARRGSR